MSVGMKKSMSVIRLTVGLFAPLAAQGQGTIYLSNLGEPSAGSVATGNDAWIAKPFVTGNVSGAYELNSIQLLMDNASGIPSDFAVSIYSSNLRQPATSLGNLSGPDPAAGGVFTYSTSGITLSRFTLYFIVVTAATPVANGSYNWSFANSASYNSADQWLNFTYSYTSSDGSQWTRNDHPFQFAVYGTAVPEPATYALVGLGLACLRFWRRKTG